ncbi:MAG: hypothetical protein SF187_23590 [Deltaproteobacteria bacterium]|nr:hypothetical protein [Deltaproteobacteria bacterium]
MGCANRKGALPDAAQALLAEHEAKLEALAKLYVGKVEAVRAAREKAIATIRSKASQALIELVADFEKERSIMLVKCALACEGARGEPDAAAADGVPRRQRRTGAN